MNLRESFNAVMERLETLQHARLDRNNNLSLEDTLRGHSEQPTFHMVGSITPFDEEKPKAILHFFESIENVGELRGNEEKLRFARLRLIGTALSVIHSEDQVRLSMYAEAREVLTQRFSNKALKDCNFWQLFVIQQCRGKTIKALADQVGALNEKTVRVNSYPELNAALREEADRPVSLCRFPVGIRELINSVMTEYFGDGTQIEGLPHEAPKHRVAATCLHPHESELRAKVTKSYVTGRNT
ncbi:hypothetical protein J6590_066568 [Homalodisca vitripennis]|nr:hypothetical protein J6590_066568 [Homalodisca vitripennis]